MSVILLRNIFLAIQSPTHTVIHHYTRIWGIYELAADTFFIVFAFVIATSSLIIMLKEPEILNIKNKRTPIKRIVSHDAHRKERRKQ